jgi:hypothetical protein
VSEDDAAMGFLTRQARPARDLVGPFSQSALDALQSEAAELMARDEHIAGALLTAGDSVAGQIRRIARAAANGAPDAAVEVAVVRADSPMARAVVAKSFVTAREAGVVDEHLAAAVLISLVGSQSIVTEAALLNAVRALAGGEALPRTRQTPIVRPASA